jgi:predicted CXXCH cytochrome family protein
VTARRALAATLASLIGLITAATPSASIEGTAPTEVGNDACRPCHAQIYETYSRTPMSRTSGRAASGLLAGEFTHRRSGIHYRVFSDAKGPTLAFDRPGDRGISGRLPLKYYVGSNTRGRTFLFSVDRFLYQSPINFYARSGAWDMSPGYADLETMPLNHVVDRTCLFCHASRVATPEPGTANRFDGEPFLQDGVGCERCHGAGSEHVAGRGHLLDPRTVPADVRDSLCTQCHLEGQARIARAGRALTDFRPGDRLSDTMAVFVFENGANAARGAVSHVESLAASVCKRKSGDAMSCLSCHDPHVQTEPSARAAYYRGKCLQCHGTLAAEHHPDRPDCTGCHMPRVESADIGHTAVTDHRILKDPSAAVGIAAGNRLVPFGAADADNRELGLAYAEIALRGDARAAGEARRLLDGIVGRYPADPQVLTRLAWLDQQRHDVARAETLYQRAVAANPGEPVAATNLGVILAGQGFMTRALSVWQPAFDRHPDASELGVDVALAMCRTGNWKGAEETVRIVLEHNPDFQPARQVGAALARGPDACRIETER